MKRTCNQPPHNNASFLVIGECNHAFIFSSFPKPKHKEEIFCPRCRDYCCADLSKTNSKVPATLCSCGWDFYNPSKQKVDNRALQHAYRYPEHRVWIVDEKLRTNEILIEELPLPKEA